jgi:hypothetical protein
MSWTISNSDNCYNISSSHGRDIARSGKESKEGFVGI